MLLLLVFMQLTRDLFAIAKLLYELDLEALTTALARVLDMVSLFN